MKKFYTFEPKNFRIFSKMKSFLAVALLLLMAVGTANAQETRTLIFSEMGYANAHNITAGDTVVAGYINYTAAQKSATNPPAYYTSGGGSVRMYTASNNKGNSMTLTTENGAGARS